MEFSACEIILHSNISDFKLGMIAHAHNPSTLDTEVEEPRVRDQLTIHSKTLFQKNKQTNKTPQSLQ